MRYLLIFSVFAALVILAACGGGGDDTVSDNILSGSGDDTASNSILSGYASKGPIDGGTVTVFALDAAGNTGEVLGTTTTAADGSYSCVIDPYTGAILVELDGGTYTDEATGLTINNNVLRAVTEFVGDTVVAITPLTEMAVQKAGALTMDNIALANNLVSGLVGGFDIIATLPADALTPPSATATSQQLDYALVLAALSQMVNDQPTYGTIDDVLAAVSIDLSDNQLDTVGTAWSSALAQFLGSANNQTGLTVETTELGQILDDATNRPINTDAVSVMTSIAFGNTISSSADGTYYSWPVALLVNDADGKPVANRQVFLKLWPVEYYHGYWAQDGNGTCQVYYTNWPAATCTNSYLQANEDINMDLVLDAGEDVGPMGNSDGFLTPHPSSAGTVPSFVTTDANGVANFEISYLKSYAVWIKDRLTISTSALMNENQTTSEFTLPILATDADLCDAGGVLDSPYGYVPECTVP